jgi:environmental stress-induced protein Ves
MPWKNGGGKTTEIFRISNGESFIFRLSMADVLSNGPFSRFPNIDRILLLIKGNGFHLEGLNTSLTDHQTSLYFKGETAVNCRLINGPCRDFNVMTDRSYAKSLISVVELLENASIILKAECDFRFIYDKDEQELYKLDLGEQCTISADHNKSLIIVDVTKL